MNIHKIIHIHFIWNHVDKKDTVPFRRSNVKKKQQQLSKALTATVQICIDTKKSPVHYLCPSDT